MILGASILQVPAIKKAKEMGFQVIAVDKDINAVGFEFADIKLVISTIDTPRVLEAAKKYQIDSIMTVASDLPMRTVAKVAQKLSLKSISIETSMIATNKGLMRDCLKDNSVPIPYFTRVGGYDDFLKSVLYFNGKVITKPADNSGSRGVYLIDNKSDSNIEFAFNYAKENSRNGEILIEEFMEGPEVSVESISIDGKVNIIAITDKLTTGAPGFVEMGHSQPSMLNREIKKEIEIITRKAIQAIGLNDGPAHTEIIITNEGPKIVEIGARLGGDNISSHLVPLSTGIDMIKACIEIASGEAPVIKKKLSKGSAIRYIKAPKGKIKEIQGINKATKINGVNKVVLLKNVGEYSVNIESSLDRIGYIIAQASDVEKAIKICEEAINSIFISVENQVEHQ
ncbi:lactate dehydrogenase [Fictibacillus aquaticus]|uniref:Lactate dehydrogenase n=2 Tax=Fictibacillus aquaticus TaxID=2021314 RepID=A0A235F935_9BACL|nr:lactate dehydrogenase [Fictibacillus aquaticus]